MKGKRFTDEQIPYALRQAESGTSVAVVCRQIGVSEASFYPELRKLVPRLSDKVLTERLRDSTKAGLVVRQETAGSRTTTYTLTERGRSLSVLLQHLYSWGVENSSSFGVRVGAPLADLASEPETERGVHARSRAQPRDLARMRGS